MPHVSPRLVLAACLVATGPAAATEFVVQAVLVTDTKAVYGRIESRFVIPARTRIGGTIIELAVSEGDMVAAGQVVARVTDEKMALRTAAVDARIRAANSELANARAELERAQALLARGATTQQRIDLARTQVDVLINQVAQATAERAIIQQETTEGDVLAPAAGRVLTVPARNGGVMLPGEVAATIAGGGVFLRLAIPERHAATLAAGAKVEVGDRGMTPQGMQGVGRIAKVYPQIENGRVIADVEVEHLPDSFVGERVLVRVPVATRSVIAVPQAAIATRAGLDTVRIATPAGQQDLVVVIGDRVATADGPRREVLSGLRAGDRVILP
jgi:RND family efflux transporter MFP subunit